MIHKLSEEDKVHVDKVVRDFSILDLLPEGKRYPVTYYPRVRELFAT